MDDAAVGVPRDGAIQPRRIKSRLAPLAALISQALLSLIVSRGRGAVRSTEVESFRGAEKTRHGLRRGGGSRSRAWEEAWGLPYADRCGASWLRLRGWYAKRRNTQGHFPAGRAWIDPHPGSRDDHRLRTDGWARQRIVPGRRGPGGWRGAALSARPPIEPVVWRMSDCGQALLWPGSRAVRPVAGDRDVRCRDKR